VNLVPLSLSLSLSSIKRFLKKDKEAIWRNKCDEMTESDTFKMMLSLVNPHLKKSKRLELRRVFDRKKGQSEEETTLL
jgi:hypothetical protein